MSVTTSSANVDPPPLLFGQRSPTPPAFASFPQSTPQSPTSPRVHPPLLLDDADRIHNNSLPPAPRATQSESEDSDMDDTDGSVEEPPAHSSQPSAPPDLAHPRNAPAVIPREGQDAMDTSPDPPGSITFGFPSGPPFSLSHLDDATMPPPPPSGNEDPPFAAGEGLHRTNSRGSSIDSGGDPDERPRHSLPPPPPPPPVSIPPQSAPGSPRAENAVVEQEETSDDEIDVLPPWRELKEDTSVPDEEELREIEVMGEHSALDDEYWQKKTFQSLEDPEYTPGPTGRLDWTIPNYNGTRENPNRELLMKSPIVNIGGFDWQIKFYPRGNDSDFLSVYVECLSVARKDDHNGAKSSRGVAGSNPETPVVSDKPQPRSAPSASQEYQQGPLPLLTEEPVPKRRSVAAQVSVVLYNPGEPRTNYFRQCSHRFCPDSPDWGWTRFAGPHFEIHYRQRGQRQPLLRNDKLALTAHIRTINDPTECLWEHHNRENRWDSFAMTGLQGLADSEYDSHGGSLIAAISSWMLLKPFRQFLYELKLADPVKDARARPKPLLSALQRTLYKLRTEVRPGCGPVDLDDIADALEWYGTDSCLGKLDVIEIWEVLRAKIEFELADMSCKDKFKDLFGPERDRMLNIPTYRAPVKDCPDMQTAIDKSVNLVQPGAPLPKLLHMELERQEFNQEHRSMQKLADRVKLLEKVTINKTAYILYGFIVHKDSLQSGSYYSVIRPRGPGGKWYAYNDGKDENRVVCLTRRQAIDAHEGGGSEKSAVAYIVMYVRQDVVPKQFSRDEPKWEVPQWLKNRDPPGGKPVTSEPSEETLDFQVFDSAAFLQHEGPGIIDPCDPKWESSPYRSSIQLPASASARETRNLLAQQFNAKDPRQVKFWFLDHTNGTSHRPTMRSSSNIEDLREDPDHASWTLRTAAEHWPERRIWLHVLDFADLPELPKSIQTSVSEIPESGSAGNTRVDYGGDSPMNDADDNGSPTDEQMDLVITEGLAAQAARQHPADVTSDQAIMPPRPPQPSVADSSDTEMANNNEAVQLMPPPPPPPAPSDFITPPLQSMSDVVQTILSSPFDYPVPPPIIHDLTASHDEIYYFLKELAPETQTLRAQNMILAKKNDRIDHSVLDALGWPRDTPLDMYEEEAPNIATKVQRGSMTFNQASIHSTAILIAQVRLSPEQRAELATRALFADPADYVQHATAARFATPTAALTGHFTMDYFSSEHYTGTLVRGRPHGTGRHCYFDGGEYVGAFRLGARHGNFGRLTHPNGDVYEGEWEANVPEGRGSFIEHATGNSYLGGWKAGKKFGEGVTHWKNAQEVERLCRICWEEGADAAFYDCGHVVACLGCARRVDACPVCRRRVLSAMKLYFGN